jgi:hypothetical protein
LVFNNSNKLKALGLSASKAGYSLFFYTNNKCTIYVLVYVDDIIITSSSSVFTDTFVKKLNHEFSLKDLGDLHYFLGIEVKRSKHELVMTQERFALDILGRVNMSNCRAVHTPMPPREKTLVNDGEPLGPRDATLYRSIVGALQYLMLTRPDLSFTVNCVCQWRHNPTMVHWERVKQILRYVKGTVQYGIKFTNCSSLILSGFSDADWAGCTNGRWSTGILQFF